MTIATIQKETKNNIQKGLRAYLGMYGAAYDRIQPEFKKASKRYDDYADKGQKLERVAQDYVKDTSLKATKSYGVWFDKIRTAIPNSANERIIELEAELEETSAALAKFTKTA